MNIELGYQTFDFEFLIVCRAMRGDDIVLRQLNFFTLQKFLQQRFCILAERFWIDGFKHWRIQRAYDPTGCIKTSIKKNRTEQGFQRICQNGRTTKPT